MCILDMFKGIFSLGAVKVINSCYRFRIITNKSLKQVPPIGVPILVPTAVIVNKKPNAGPNCSMPTRSAVMTA